MLVVMRDHASVDEIDHVVDVLEEAGAQAHRSQGEIKTIIGVIGDRETIYSLELEGLARRRRGHPGTEALQARGPGLPGRRHRRQGE